MKLADAIEHARGMAERYADIAAGEALVGRAEAAERAETEAAHYRAVIDRLEAQQEEGSEA